MENFKTLVNYLSNPTILVTGVLILFPFIFPPTNWFEKVNTKLKIYKLWSGWGLLIMTVITIAFFVFGFGAGAFNFDPVARLYFARPLAVNPAPLEAGNFSPRPTERLGPLLRLAGITFSFSWQVSLQS